MTAVVVDTCVVSFFIRGDSRAKAYRRHLVGNTPVISFMTLAELYRWAARRNWGEQRTRGMEEYLRARYILYPYNRDLCLRWATGVEEARRKGYTVRTADAWIASTALLHDVPLITNNAKDFRGITDLKVISESPASQAE